MADLIKKLQVLLDVDDQASSTLKTVRRESDDVEASFEDAYSASKKLGVALEAVGTAAAGGAIAIGLLTRYGSRLDKTFAVIKETSNATKQQMDAIRNSVKQIGAVTPVSLGQAAEAFKQLSYAGFQAEEAIRSARDVVELAVAGQLKMGRAAKVTAQNIRAFSLRADQAGQVSNTLAAVFASSATNVSALAQGMSYLNTTASQLNQTFTQSATALGVLADAGIEGSRAGTALNQALGKLVSGAGDTNKALKAIGFTLEDFKDKKGNFLPLIDVVSKLQQRLKAMGIEGAGRQRFLNDLVGRRGARAFGKLIQRVDAFQSKLKQTRFAQLEAAVENIKGLTGRQRKAMSVKLFSDIDASRLKNMNQKELVKQFPDLDVSLGKDANLESLVTNMREKFGTGKQAQARIQTRLRAGLGMEKGTAEWLAAQISDASQSVAGLREQFEKVSTAADLLNAQMRTVSGKLRYLKSSFTSMAKSLYNGFRPALESILNGLMVTADWLTNHPALLRAMGAALFGLTAALGAATIALGGMYAKSVLVMAATEGLSKRFGTLRATSDLLSGEIDDISRTLLGYSSAADDAARSTQHLDEMGHVAAEGMDEAAMGASRFGRNADEAAEGIGTLALMKGKLKGLGGRLKGLGKRVANLGPSWSKVGTAAKGAVRGLGGKLWGLTIGMDALFGSMSRTRGTAKGLAKTFSSKLGSAVLKLSYGIAGLGGYLMTAGQALVGAFGTMASLGVSGTLSAIGTSLYGVAGSVASVLGVINPLVWAIGAAVGIFVAWKHDIGGMREELSGFVFAVDNATQGIQNFASDALGFATWMLRGFYDVAQDSGAIEFFAGLIRGAADAVGVFGDIIGGTIHTTARLFHYLGRIANIAGEGAWNVLTGKFGRMRDTVHELVELVEKLTGLDFNSGVSKAKQQTRNQGLPENVMSTQGTGNAAKRGKKAGKQLNKTFAEGQRQTRGRVTAETQKTVEEVGSYLPASNAKRGPLSNLRARGEGMMQVFGQGMRRGRHRVTKHAKKVAEQLRNRFDFSDLSEKSQSNIERIADSIESLEDVTGELDEKFAGVAKSVNAVIDTLEDLGRFRLNIGGIGPPMAWLHQTMDGVFGLGGDIMSWFRDFDGLELNLAKGIINPLKDVHSWLSKIANKAGNAVNKVNNVQQQDDSGKNGGNTGKSGKNGGKSGETGAHAPRTAKNTGEKPPESYPSRKGTERGTVYRKQYGRKITAEDIQSFRAGLSKEQVMGIKQRYGIPKNKPIPDSIWRKEMRRQADGGTGKGKGKGKGKGTGKAGGLGAGVGMGSLGAGMSSAAASMKLAASALLGGGKRKPKPSKPAGTTVGGSPYGLSPQPVRAGRVPSFVPTHAPGETNVTVNNNTTVNQTVKEGGSKETKQKTKEGVTEGNKKVKKDLKDSLKTANGQDTTSGSN